VDDTIIAKLIENGYALPVVIWFLMDKYSYWHRKKTGKWVSWEDMENDIVNLEKDLNATKETVKENIIKINGHLEKEADKDVMFAKLQSQHGHLTDKIMDLKGAIIELTAHQEKTFDMITKIKDRMLERGI